MSFNATWSMAVGGMVGGGIFSVLGVVIETAGGWAWLSFLIAGVIALISAHSYSQLTVKHKESGGAFIYLRKLERHTFAGSLSWLLILGYVLTISVYAFTFGEYVAHVFNVGPWLPRVLSLVVIGAFTALNLRGVGDISRAEIITVYGKLFVLVGLAAFGLWQWNPEQLSAGIGPKPWYAALVGAATIFMAYEGFQLLSYDYHDMRRPDVTLPWAAILAVLAVIVVYIMVTLGAAMLVGARALVEQKEVALSVAGQQALGLTGLGLVTVAAAFSTGSAINATLFSTSRLMQSVSEGEELPPVFARQNRARVPHYAIGFIGVAAALLAAVGDLSTLVEAASLIFLLTFGIVNVIAFLEDVPGAALCLLGATFCGAAIGVSGVQQFLQAPYVTGGMLLFVALIFIARPWLVRKH
ncbi:MAG: APC family permease [Thiohalocapsa sp.]|uniref:APC family permease n=1 Tax=Thiohalocapsa sp. TaxID=2497641 RepID=UPI0025EE4CE9|nr:APC family permease [Thiohalocapsa sp.]MCG6941503.1 APC family permease [Thiohalocapsa sp.]